MNFAQRYGKWALIAGASTGLGAAFAHEAAKRGLHVVLVARRGDLMQETAASITDAHGVDVRTVTLDLGHVLAANQLADEVADLELGLVIYNAAAEPQGRFLDTPLTDLHANIAVNCTTPTALLMHLAPPMIGRGRGGIVLVSSMGALQGIKIFAAYGAAKSYELILAEGLWDEFGDFGVDAFAYVVGATATPNFINNASKVANADPESLAKLIEQSGQAVGSPRTPEAVAETMFGILDARDTTPIQPRHFSHPDDEARAHADAQKSRREVVEQMGRMTSAVWK